MIKFTSISKTFQIDDAEVQAVKSLDLEIQQGEFFTLLGPSGCGKTTSLRCVAGFEKPEKGEITIGDELVVSKEKNIFIPPNKRRIGMVFQSYAIWPHMSVFDNVAFPLRYGENKVPKSEVRGKVSKALTLVRLAGLEARPAPQLSGGQQQRLALARALVREPNVLLLDEPLSNLDAKLREDMRIELREIIHRLGITTLYVTHDQLEALAMSDRVGVMSNGELSQVATPKEIYKTPNNEFVASFIGSTNLIKGTVEKVASNQETGDIKTELGVFSCRLPKGIAKDDMIIISARPEDLVATNKQPSQRENVLEGKVVTNVFCGDFIDCRVMVNRTPIRLKLHPSMGISEGDPIYIQLVPSGYTVIPLKG